jgi:hypothetical protein
LIDERFAAAGWHDDHRIAPIEQRLHRFPLTGLELHVPETLREDVTRASQGRVLLSMLRHIARWEALSVPLVLTLPYWSSVPKAGAAFAL